VKKPLSSKANNLTPKYAIVKKNQFHKKIKGKKYEAIMVNLTNLLSEI
jgi:hypothetical protein